MGVVGERHDAEAPDPQHVLEHRARLAHGLDGLRQDHVVERAVRVDREVGVGVALDHGQPLADAVVHALLAELDAARVDVLGARQIGEQRAVGAADVEHPGVRLDQLGDQAQVLAQTVRRAVTGATFIGAADRSAQSPSQHRFSADRIARRRRRESP